MTVRDWVGPGARERLDLLRATNTVAVVGASPNPARASFFVATYLLASTDYDTYFVNPVAAEEILTPLGSQGLDGRVPLVHTGASGAVGGSPILFRWRVPPRRHPGCAHQPGDRVVELQGDDSGASSAACVD